jgi:hypothetical protein
MADKDPLGSFPISPTRFGRFGALVTPSNTVDLTVVAKAIVHLEGGDVSVIPALNEDANPINFVAVPAGYIVPFEVRRVLATGTSGTVAAIYDEKP